MPKNDTTEERIRVACLRATFWCGLSTFLGPLFESTNLRRDNLGREIGSTVRTDRSSTQQEIGGAPRNPAPRNHCLVWIVKPSGCHRTDAFGGNDYRRVPTPLRSTSPVSDQQSFGACDVLTCTYDDVTLVYTNIWTNKTRVCHFLTIPSLLFLLSSTCFQHTRSVN